jgi:hypothetical protein
MSKADEYRANAAECQRMAGMTNNPAEKATWLGMAEHWLRMIPKQSKTPAEKFDAAEAKQGTHQTQSKAEH